MKGKLPTILISATVILLGVFLIAWNFLPEDFFFRQAKISAVSDVSGYRLILTKPKELDHYLEEFGFWQESGVYLLGEKNQVKIKKVVIHLTDKEQPLFPVAEPGGKELVQAVGEECSEGTLHLFCYISPQTLKEENQATISQRIDGQVLRYTFFVAHSLAKPELFLEAEEKGELRAIEKIMADLEKKGRLFNLKKI